MQSIVNHQPSIPQDKAQEAFAPASHLTLSFAGATFAIELSSPDLAPPLLERYGHFMKAEQCVIKPTATIYVEQRLDPDRVAHWRPSHPPPSLKAMNLPPHSLEGRVDLLRGEGTIHTMEVNYFTCRFDGIDKAEVTLYSDNIQGGFDQFFANLFIDVMLPQHCILLHSSGAIHEGKAYLFSGPSGAGKTTTIENSPGRTILSDELVAVSYAPDTQTFWAHGTPFYGSWGQVGESVSAPLHSIHFLQQDQYHHIEALPPKESFRRMCQVICAIRPTPAMTEQFLHWADRLVPYCRLFGLVPEPSLWTYLAKAETINKGLLK